jgi:hypothetical protein
MNISRLSRAWPCVAVVLAVFALTGCQQQSKVSFNESIRLSLDSVRAGDLEMADLHLDNARPNAKTPSNKRIVASVDELIDGAEAMMAGDIAQAKADWSSIPDPQFNREVRVKADAVMGIKVPLVVLDKEVSK